MFTSEYATLRTVQALTGCGKTVSAQQNPDACTSWPRGEHPRRMLKKFVQQGRSKQGRLRLRRRLNDDLTFFLSALASVLTFR